MHGELEANAASARRLGRLAQAMRAALDLVAGVALPQLCASCREPVDGAGLCANCWSKLSFIAPPYCERLGIPFAFDAGPGLLSMEAIADPPAYGRARAAVRYDEIARTLVHAFKYGVIDSISHLSWEAGWRMRADPCWQMPTPSCRYRC